MRLDILYQTVEIFKKGKPEKRHREGVALFWLTRSLYQSALLADPLASLEVDFDDFVDHDIASASGEGAATALQLRGGADDVFLALGRVGQQALVCRNRRGDRGGDFGLWQ